MSATVDPSAYPLRAFDVEVRRIKDVGPHFRRITFAGGVLDRFGVPGPTRDLRIKLLIPAAGQPQALLGEPDGRLYQGWYQDWLKTEQPERGFIRSYTVAAIRATAQGREIDVDFVIHRVAEGHGAPASEWAAAAAVGTRAVIIGPEASAITTSTRLSETGIRWEPQGAGQVLLAGDETAVPAISSILKTLPADIGGHAFLEVPDPADFRTISTGSAVRVTWLARQPTGSARGALLDSAIRRSVPKSGTSGVPGRDTYAWVAAEAATVQILRRYLVNEVGLDPKRSEFRGYWSQGKAGSGINGTPVGQEPQVRRR
ncbi:siderophore-interacting protein [Arthrobacter oryzae]|uniref:siderophore-interacting protein n=1 Tax=Arthrobacter oryzae TaxID=409290 RepID=UPI0028650465|nr:siderophore-interacting protein [Arthrobacter oryzae]MDR6507182.1 NADPH-dependent ferric siderophore reductase [Arthrobacter oryzae]